MTVIKLHLDNQTFERIKDIADSRRATVEALIEDIIEHLVATQDDEDPLLGMFAQEPDLMDAVVTSAMQARQEHPLRVDNRTSTG